MSRLYVKVQCGFYAHRKTLRLRAALGFDAFWVPPRLWAYAAENKPDGVFDDFSPEEIATCIGFTGDASRMLQALLKAGFMDDKPLRIHDWAEHNAFHQTFADRAQKAAKARWSKLAPPPSKPSLNIDIDKDREASIASSNACSIPSLSISERISLERELERASAELRNNFTALKDYPVTSSKHKRMSALLARQTELRQLLGVVA